MVYTTKWLLDKIAAGENPEYLFFWGHQPQKDGKIGACCFSQWWICNFKDDKYIYSSAEQYMMAGKAKLFNDLEIFEEIIRTSSPQQVKALGRKISNFDEKTWKANRYEIVKKGNLLKFSQNTDLKEFIVSTSSKVLVEASPVDPIWGIGLAKDNPNAAQPENWKGTNLLGFALMEVRDELANN